MSRSRRPRSGGVATLGAAVAAALLAFVCLSAQAAPARATEGLPAAAHAASASAASRRKARRRSSARRVHRRRERRAPSISDARGRQIEAALVRAGYLRRAGDSWNAAGRAAMRKFQRDHHWQDRYVPDARALIALGLGPKYDSPPPPAPPHS